MTRRCMVLAALGAVGLAGCLDNSTGAIGQPPGSAAGECEPGRLLAVAGSDYESSALSMVDLAQLQAVKSAFLSSGSGVGATGAAFSGDTVIASGAPCRAIAVDRTSGVLTLLQPGDGSGPAILRQINVSGGFYSNVQDSLWLDDGTVVALRAQAAVDKDLGDDLSAWDAVTAESRWRRALRNYSTLDGGFAFGGRSAWDGGTAWVPLASVGKAFDAMGPGAVCRTTLTGGQDAIACQHVPGARNCTVARWIPARKQAAVVCSGFFKAEDQVVESALVLLRPVGDGVQLAVHQTVSAQVTERPGAPARPFFGDVACDERRCWVIALGDGASKRRDAVWQVELGDAATATVPKASIVRESSAPFSTSALHFDQTRRRLWIADTADPKGDLHVWSCEKDSACTPLATVDSNPGGLPAVSIEGL